MKAWKNRLALQISQTEIGETLYLRADNGGLGVVDGYMSLSQSRANRLTENIYFWPKKGYLVLDGFKLPAPLK